MARLQDFYKAEVAPALMKKFNYKSPMQIPRFDKIVINKKEGVEVPRSFDDYEITVDINMPEGVELQEKV